MAKIHRRIAGKLRNILSIALAAALAASLAAPAAALEIDGDNYKFFKMETVSPSQPITESFFSYDTASLYRPYFVQGDADILLSFSLQYSQPANIALYECTDQSAGPLTDPSDVREMKTGEALCGEFIGYIAGYRYTGNIDIPDGSDPERPEKVYLNTGCDVAKGIDNLIGSSKTATPTSMQGEYFFGTTGDIAPQLFTSASAPVTFIQNLILWKGDVVSADGGPIDAAWEDGKTYVMVVEPSEANQQFKSYLPFVANTAMAAPGFSPIEYPELVDVWASDPVSLVDGSLTWDYTDIALYGAAGLPFSRHYSSKYSGINRFGCGAGWSHNYAYKMDMQRIFARVYLPDGSNIVFDIGQDGLFYAKPGSAFTLTEDGGGFLLKT